MDIETPELVAGIRTGDPEAQRAVVEDYLPQILRASRAAGLDPAAAEDVAQIREQGVRMRERFGREDEPDGTDELQRRILETAAHASGEQDSS